MSPRRTKSCCPESAWRHHHTIQRCDDIGVKSVTFTSGGDVLSVDSEAPCAWSFTPGATATISGRLFLPSGPSAREACSGELAITYERGSRTVESKRIKLTSSCSYATRESLAPAGYTVSVQFRGNDVLAAIKAANRKATVR